MNRRGITGDWKDLRTIKKVEFHQHSATNSPSKPFICKVVKNEGSSRCARWEEMRWLPGPSSLCQYPRSWWLERLQRSWGVPSPAPSPPPFLLLTTQDGTAVKKQSANPTTCTQQHTAASLIVTTTTEGGFLNRNYMKSMKYWITGNNLLTICEVLFQFAVFRHLIWFKMDVCAHTH